LTDETLTDYLEGELDPAVKAASEVHLVVCDKCRTSLGYFMRLLDEEVKPEEVAAMEAIAGEWNRKKLKARPPTRIRLSLKFVVPVAAMLIISVIAGRFLMERSAEPKSAGEVVELLLAQNRPFETRISNEPHMPIRRTRGPADAGASYDLLATEMTRLYANSHELGQFYLLQKDFTRAVPYLETAERAPAADAAIHNDLGVAYLESGNAVQVAKAAVEFRHALQANGAFAPAVFNLGIYYERMNALAMAEMQWTHYLALDSKSEWASEARERLQGLSR